jgi:CHAT domain-containing protein
MDALYRRLARGLEPPDALRAAKLDLLHSQNAYRKPYYWAPFVTYTRHWPVARPAIEHP